MPEMPEVEGLAEFLRSRLLPGAVVADVEVVSFAVLKTVQPPVTALAGMTVTGVSRHGKFVDIDVDGVHLIFHLGRAGWLKWSDALSDKRVKPGRGPLGLRVRFDLSAMPPAAGAVETDEGPTDDGGLPRTGFDLTEAGTQKHLAAYVVESPSDVPGIASLGPEPLELDTAGLVAVVRQHRGQLKGLLRDQHIFAGIGNAYSDEILHAAKLSPFLLASKLEDADAERLAVSIHEVLRHAVAEARGKPASELKDTKRSHMRVHGRTGEACPVCGDTILEVSFSSSSLQYCPTCQTGGKPLADRRTSKFLR